MFDRYGEAAIACGALGPFFVTDPSADGMDVVFAAYAGIDEAVVAREWPFVSHDKARDCLSLMREGSARGVEDALVWEYRRLFVGPGPMPAPPWGSVYTDRECVVFGEATLALRSWMRSSGIARLSDEKTPEDHIGLMLLLAAWLAGNRPELMGEFLQEHLLPWSSHMLDQLEKASCHPFYCGIAGLAKLTLEGLGEAMDLHPVEPRFYR